MTKQHTPGPWRKGSRYQSIVAESDTGHDDWRSLDSYSGHMVCESVKWESNQNLIAAAPELLSVLEIAVSAAGHGDFWVGDARKAILKAKGKT